MSSIQYRINALYAVDYGLIICETTSTILTYCEGGAIMDIKGHILRWRMNKLEIKEVELAEKLGITHCSISKWMNGETGIKRKYVFPLCDELGLTVEQLTGEETIPLKPFETVDYALMILRAHGFKISLPEKGAKG